jgi:hypothetical protein
MNMICGDFDAVSFHFGAMEGEERAAAEAHVLECRECLQKYLDVKRSIETADAAPRPSDMARARLKRAVAKELGVRPARWWERPLAFAAAACAVLAAGQAMRAITSTPASPPYAMHDQPR